MAKSVVKLAAILLAIALVCYVAIFGVAIGRNFHIPGVTEGIQQGLDLVGGSVIVFEADTDSPTPEQLNSAQSVLRTRLDGLMLHDATIEHLQATNRLRVEIPAMGDPHEAAAVLGEVGLLTFIGGDGQFIMTGAYVESASVQNDFTIPGAPRQRFIEFNLTEEGRQAFAAATARLAGMQAQNVNENFSEMAAEANPELFPNGVNIGLQSVLWNSVAIVLDENLVSAPRVQERLDTTTLTITGGGPGGFEVDEADHLTNIINSGRLEVPLRAVQLSYVSATLGPRALETSLWAGLIGLLLIMLFMMVFYKLPGLMSSIALVGFISIVGLILANFNVNLTLPGIAGIILSIGMANDANILIFERLKEEMRNGKTVRASVDSGFRRALPAIVDGELTTLFIAIILWVMGEGPVAGFGMALAIGVVVSFFSAVVLTRMLLNQMVGLSLKQPWLYGVSASSKGGEA